jgi:hypothetical protein
MTVLREGRGQRRVTLFGTHVWRDERAAEIVEMAFVMPLLVTLLVGVFWAARAYNAYETVTLAAREGARVAVAPTCFGCGSNGAFLSSSGCSGTSCCQVSGSTDAIDAAVMSSLAASNLCLSGETVAITQHSQLGDDISGSSTQWTIVTVTYPFQFLLPFTSVNMTTVHISATAQMVEEP